MGITNVSGFQRRRRELAAKLADEEATKKTTEIKTIDEMTVAELKQYAAENGIDLGTATKKSDILATIQAAQNDGGGQTGRD